MSFKDQRKTILDSLLPDGDKYDVLLATTDAECTLYEIQGYFFIGRGVLEGDDPNRFCAYLKLREGYRE